MLFLLMQEILWLTYSVKLTRYLSTSLITTSHKIIVIQVELLFSSHEKLINNGWTQVVRKYCKQIWQPARLDLHSRNHGITEKIVSGLEIKHWEGAIKRKEEKLIEKITNFCDSDLSGYDYMRIIKNQKLVNSLPMPYLVWTFFSNTESVPNFHRSVTRVGVKNWLLEHKNLQG